MTSSPISDSPRVFVIIPAFNEEEAIGKVIEEIPAGWVTETIVVSNGSTDQTEAVAAAAGATVLVENRRGYGSACLKGIAYARNRMPDMLVFLDGDHSDYPEEIPNLLAPILQNKADLVIGSRVLGKKEKGSLSPQQVFGNWLATKLLRLIYGVHYTDLGPFRAIRFDQYEKLGMKDPDYGWTMEMQVKAAKQGIKSLEIPVRYRKRIGESKVSGTLKGSIMAGYKILLTLFKYSFS